MSWRAMAAALALCLAAPCGAQSPGPGGSGSFQVAVRVVASHQAVLARELAMPVPGHDMREDRNGRHYYFKGSLQTAHAFFVEQLQRQGYTLQGEHRGPHGHSMRWRRHGQALLLDLQAAAGLNPTRISLRVMKDDRAHVPG